MTRTHGKDRNEGIGEQKGSRSMRAVETLPVVSGAFLFEKSEAGVGAMPQLLQGCDCCGEGDGCAAAIDDVEAALLVDRVFHAAASKDGCESRRGHGSGWHGGDDGSAFDRTEYPERALHSTCEPSSVSRRCTVSASVCSEKPDFANDADSPLEDPTLAPQGEAPIVGATVLAAQGLAYHYPSSDKLVFENVNLGVETGRVLAILGNNGAGKSTLLDVLAGMVRPSSGFVSVDGRPLHSLGRRQIAQHIAYVTQCQRIPHLSVYDQVLLGRRPHITWTLADRDRAVVADTIDRLNLGCFSDRFLDELSGGERQKVYLARALAQEPEVLLLDEPTSALDPKNQLEVLDAMRSITQRGSLATVLVIHDVNLALRFCDTFLLMRDGMVVAQGGREAVDSETLFATYGIRFCVEQVAGVPVAVPLDGPGR